MKNRVIMIGLDGLSWHILNKLVDRNIMPNLGRIIDHGAKGIIRSTIPPTTAPAWTSITSGVNPGKHGVFSFQRLNSNYDTKLANSLTIMHPRLHEILMLSGYKSVVINLPLSYPFIKSKKTTIVTDWLAPSLKIHPTNIKNLVSSYHLSPPWNVDKTKFLSDLEGRIDAITNLFEYGGWDLFFVLFSEPDWMMHLAYDAIMHDRKNATRIYRAFNLLDKFIGYIAKNLERNDLLITLSDHGFAEFNKVVYVNTILSYAGLVNKRISIKQETILKKKYKKTYWILKCMNTCIHGNASLWKILRKPLWKILDSIDVSNLLSYDLRSSKTFLLTQIDSGVYINSNRIFKSGLVEAEMEQKIQNKVIKILKGLRDPKTKDPPFSYIGRREDTYWGPYVRRAPHVLFIPNIEAGYGHSSLPSPKILDEVKKSSCHSMYGILIAYEKAIQREIDLGILNTYDITPTVLHYLGLSVPFDTDGKILFNMFTKDSEVRLRPAKMKNYIERWKIARYITKKTYKN